RAGRRGGQGGAICRGDRLRAGGRRRRYRGHPRVGRLAGAVDGGRARGRGQPVRRAGRLERALRGVSAGGDLAGRRGRQGGGRDGGDREDGGGGRRGGADRDRCGD